MQQLADVIAIAAAALNAVAAVTGGLLWWRVDPRPLAWRLVRIGQAAAVALAVVAGIAWFAGERPDDGLFWIYSLVPVAIGFFAEQLRLLAAQTVLDARGLPDAQAVGGLPADEQRSVVLQIARRELGIMALAAGVIAFLALRAYVETGGL
jgi:hypothetical protein